MSIRVYLHILLYTRTYAYESWSVSVEKAKYNDPARPQTEDGEVIQQ